MYEGSIQMYFFLILLLCVTHYWFFVMLNFINRPRTRHDHLFDYDARVEYVCNCFYQKNASVCGSIPKELDGRIFKAQDCKGKSGILLANSHFFETPRINFDVLEEWCFRSL